jgi:diaminopimelate decarboxylase
MISIEKDSALPKRTEKFLGEDLKYMTGSLFGVVEKIFDRKNKIIKLASKYATPFYVYDENALDDSIERFNSSFSREVPSFKAYYALKINHYLPIAKRAVRKGMGLDVGSPREIEIALKAGCSDILYFSPGKTNADISFALKYANKIRIHTDSFGELNKLGVITNKKKKNVKAGIRIHTNFHGNWKKYGIHMKELKRFWNEAKKYPYIKLDGIHFHMSRNEDAIFYEKTIKELGLYIKKYFSEEEYKEIKYIDFGGGFEVPNSEGFYPHKTPQGSIINTVNSHFGKSSLFKERYYIKKALTVEEYAKKIGAVIKKYLVPIIDAEYYSEPGRIICNNAMHIILSIADVKNKNNIVLDGGVNMVGWQRFEYEYFPLVNISNPSKKEIACNIWGNLCTTWDIWGYYCYAKKFKEDDVVVVPNQGALTYSLAQNFIQPIPPVYKL